MTNEQKTQIKKAVTTFLKAIIPPLVAMVSSILTTLISGDVSTSVAVGCIGGSVSTCLVGQNMEGMELTKLIINGIVSITSIIINIIASTKNKGGKK